MPESDQVALYFLFGQSDDGSTEKVYIGQTGDPRKRLVQHNKQKDFWQRALVVISRTNSLTQTHALFLEWFCIQEAKKSGRYSAENGHDGSKPHTPAPLAADCMEIFETGRTLLATLGYPIFEPVAKLPTAASGHEIFYCKRSGTSAVGEYTEEGFVVLKGSTGRATVSKSFVEHAFGKHREKLVQQGKAAIENGVLVFKEDILFPSPSGASAMVVGATSNGWKEWKNDQGATLHELKRGNVSIASHE